MKWTQNYGSNLNNQSDNDINHFLDKMAWTQFPKIQ